MLKSLYCLKSFMALGTSLDLCYGCTYCRLIGDTSTGYSFTTIPSAINPAFKHVPVAVNLFYGDPMLQVNSTVSILNKLEKAGHRGPVVVVLKGPFSKFPDIPFDLDLHIAFSTFGLHNNNLDINIKGYNGRTFKQFLLNLRAIESRKYNYKYSIEFRPIIYEVNDSYESIDMVMAMAAKYNMAVGYSGLQGKPETVNVWQQLKVPFKPYPGYTFGHKKSLSDDVVTCIKSVAKHYNVPVFSKTSCLISYTHGLNRDYNAHYYRPNEVGCFGCPMESKCFAEKGVRDKLVEPNIAIPFNYDIIYKKHHTCILKKKGICEFPTADCSKISGGLIRIYDRISTSDVRVIKWLTGYTVDADFYESPFLSNDWEFNNDC